MFEYDPAKSTANRAKHGIDFNEAQLLWLDDRIRVRPTYSGGDDERWLAVGLVGDKLWSAAFTWREDKIRLISVRRARPDESEEYEREEN